MPGNSFGTPDPGSGGRTRPGQPARLPLELNRLPDRLADVVARTDGIAISRRFPVRMAVIADPGLARALLTRPEGVTQGRGIAALRLTLGQGLLTSRGELHRRQRRLVQPAFHPGQLRRYAADAVTAARDRSAQWSRLAASGAPVDLAEEMSSLTLDIVGRTLFGSDLSGAAEEISRAQGELLRLFPRLVRPGGMLAGSWPTPIRHRLRGSVGRLDAVVHRIIDSRTAAGPAGAVRLDDVPQRSAEPYGVQEHGVQHGVQEHGVQHRDVLSILLAARDEETGQPMPRQQVRDEVLTLLLAGHETTAVALTWAWFELSRHRQARDWLADELGSPQAADLLDDAAWERLPRTRAVLAETLRLHPPAYLMGRFTTAEVPLGDWTLPRSTACLISPYALHRDPRSWGADVLQWRPERWVTAAGDYDETAPGQPRGAYLPFGAGSRMCIGAAFASMEATLVLAVLGREWLAEVPAGYDPGLAPSVTLRTRRGLPAVLHPISAPAGQEPIPAPAGQEPV